MPMDSGPCFSSAAAICVSLVDTKLNEDTDAAAGPCLALAHLPSTPLYG